MMRKIIGMVLLVLPFFTIGQSLKKADKVIIQNVQTHIKYLASDELEGRRAGSVGEQKAVDYIVAQYQTLGLKPMGVDGFIQPFPIDEGKRLTAGSFLKINKEAVLLDKEFIPLSNSGAGQFNSAAAIALNEAKQVWFKDLNEVLDAAVTNPHFDLNQCIIDFTNQVKQKGGSALFLYNKGTFVDNIQFNKFDTATALPIPVIYITKNGWLKHFNDDIDTYNINANIAFEHATRTAHNVAAFIDNHAEYTVVIGAHLDHLGYNEDHNALDINNNIRNGADDNASGTSAIIELAKLLKKKSPKNNNYLILHFSGEELGLFGSKYWLEHPTYKGKLNYMINLDMVGRYDTARKLTVGGFGTSSKWANILANTPTTLMTHYDSAGAGPSDHASFYRKDMPVLFMFTGSHSDYHKATDDWDKINYIGEAAIIQYVHAIIKNTDAQGQLDFLKTRENSMGKSNKFTVSLGVMPDYAFTGTGVRIEGATEGKLAEKLGLKGGDVLIQLGDYKLVDVMGYMVALSKFKKGDKTTLIYKRGTVETKLDIQF
jgi:aminopeptidase YwaD